MSDKFSLFGLMEKPEMSRNGFHLFQLIGLCFSTCVFAQTQSDRILKNDQWSITVNLQTLQTTAQPRNAAPIQLSLPQTNLGKVTSVHQSGDTLRWDLADKDLHIELSLDENALILNLTARRTSSFTWPIMQAIPPINALILPRAEGVYVPLDNRRWTDHLISQGEWNTLEHLSMPFWGFDCERYCLTWIATNPFNNTIKFSEKDRSLQIDFTHEFTRFPKERKYGFRILLSRTGSAIEPARQFRRYIIANNQFVSLKQKAQKVPRVNRLLGAAHVYLWGDALLSRHNIPNNKWKPFCQELIKQANASEPSPGKRIKELMKTEQWQEVKNLVAEQWPNNYQKDQIAAAISEILSRRDFYRELNRST